jgi:hypothetical protein
MIHRVKSNFLKENNQLVLVMTKCGVSFEIQTKSSYIIYTASASNGEHTNKML